MKQSMEDLGFQCLNSDAGIFLYRNKDALCIAVVYVDDCFFTGPDDAINQQLKAAFMKKWECRDLGELSEFLGSGSVYDRQQRCFNGCLGKSVCLSDGSSARRSVRQVFDRNSEQ